MAAVLLLLAVTAWSSGCGILSKDNKQPLQEEKVQAREEPEEVSGEEAGIKPGEESVTVSVGESGAEANSKKNELAVADSGGKESLVLLYDDRHTFDQEVKEIHTLKVVSKKTGTGEEDEAVLSQDEEDPCRVKASGCGETEVVFADGTSRIIRVDPAPISLFLLAGQSNCEGRINDLRRAETYKKQWVVNSEGTVYSTYGVSDDRDGMNMYDEVAWYKDIDKVGRFGLNNYERFLPVSLTDNSLNDRYNRTDTLTNAEGAPGKGGMDSAIAYRWHQLTGEKVWIVNASRHGTPIKYWDPAAEGENNYYRSAVKLYAEAEKILDCEIEAGHYTLAHKGIFWCQGEADGYLKTTPAQYMDIFERTYRGFISELDGEGTLHMDHTLDFFGLIIPRASLFRPNEPEDFVLCGARMVQYYLALSRDWPDIYMASALSDVWTNDESVKIYFREKYGDEETFNAAFPTLAGHLPMPDTLEEVHETIHYTQIAYNEIGSDAAYNICCNLGLCPMEKEKIESVTFITDDGITERNGETVYVPAKRRQQLAVRVQPSYLTKALVLELSDNLDFACTGLRIREGSEGEIRVRQGRAEESIRFTKSSNMRR